MLSDLLIVLIVFGLLFFSLMIPFMRLLAWWSDGAIDTTTAIACLLILLVLVAVVVGGSGTLKAVAVVMLLLGSIVLPAVGQFRERVATGHIHDEQMAGYIHALEVDPQNTPARISLAEELGRRGQVDQAIEQLDWVLREYPRLRPTVLPRLEKWKREKNRPAQLQVMFCHNCTAENPRGADRCSECGADFTFGRSFAEGFRTAGGTVAIVRAWVVVGLGVPIVVFALLTMDPVIAACITVATVGVAIFLFLSWVGGTFGKPMD